MNSFFSELKRRNVYKVAVASAVVGWLLIQIATRTFPFFDIPNWAIRLVTLLVVIGFPVASIIAWAFELTLEGLKRTESVTETPPKRSGGRAWIYVVIAGCLLSGATRRYEQRLKSDASETRPYQNPLRCCHWKV